MRQRTQRRLTDRADIYRREKTGENEVGEPIYGWVLVADSVPCRFDDESTEFVRGESGERVQTPATLTVAGDADLEESDRVDVDVEAWFEVTGIDRTRDHRRSRIVSATAELQESDEPEIVE